MIFLDDIWVASSEKKKRGEFMLRGVTCKVEDNEHFVILAPHSPSRASLLRLFCGEIAADRGRVVQEGTVSWPLNWVQVSKPNMTGYENIAFMCRVHNVNTRDAVEFVRYYSGLGDMLGTLFSRWPPECKLRFSYITALAMPFDHYIFVDKLAIPDIGKRFKARDFQLLESRKQGASFIVVSAFPGMVKATFETDMMVLYEGELNDFDVPEDAMKYYFSVYPR